MRTTSIKQNTPEKVRGGFIVSGCGFTGRTKNDKLKKFKTYFYGELISANLVIKNCTYQCMGKLICHLGVVQRRDVRKDQEARDDSFSTATRMPFHIPLDIIRIIVVSRVHQTWKR